MKAIYKLNIGAFKGTKRWGSKSLNFFTHHRTEIGCVWLDEDGNEQIVSIVTFRFHSSKAFCEWTKARHIETHNVLNILDSVLA